MIELYVSQDIEQQTTITLGQTAYVYQLIYDQYQGYWRFSLFLDTGEVIAKGIRVVTGLMPLRRYKRTNDPNGIFLVFSEDPADESPPRFTDMGNRTKIYFMHQDDASALGIPPKYRNFTQPSPLIKGTY